MRLAKSELDRPAALIQRPTCRIENQFTVVHEDLLTKNDGTLKNVIIGGWNGWGWGVTRLHVSIYFYPFNALNLSGAPEQIG